MKNYPGGKELRWLYVHFVSTMIINTKQIIEMMVDDNAGVDPGFL